MTNAEKREEEQMRFKRNMQELAERDCDHKRSNGIPCSKITCGKFNTSECLHPEKAGFPAQRC